MVVCPAPSPFPPVDVPTSGCSVPMSVIWSGLSGVRSFVVQSKVMSSDLPKVNCVEELKSNLLSGHQFPGCNTFDPWVVSVALRTKTSSAVSSVVTLLTDLGRLRSGEPKVVWPFNATDRCWFGLHCWPCSFWVTGRLSLVYHPNRERGQKVST